MRHTMLMSLLMYKRNYSKEYGEMVIACDGQRSWRKDAYLHYKANRKKSREESDLDWDSIFSHLSDMKTELKEIFPWRVINVSAAEGDDVIAVLAQHASTRTIQDGMFEAQEKTLVISSDKDMCQLMDLGEVRQYSPMQKKYVPKVDKNFLIEKIIRGDSGDGVPSVLCPDDWFVNEEYNGIRATAVTKKVVERFMAGTGLTDEEKTRFERNRRLISFEYIPDHVRDGILSAYHDTVPSADLNKVMTFLMSVKAKQLLDRIYEFKVK